MRRKTLPKYYDREKDLVQCQLCGKWFKALQSHIPKIHKISCEDYKDEFELWNGDLMCITTRSKMSEYHKQPQIKKKSMKRFMENVKPYSPKNKKRGKVKKRFQNMLQKRPFFNKETQKKAKQNFQKFCKTEKGKVMFKKIAEKIKKAYGGRYMKCEECGEKVWIPKYRQVIFRFCSRKCQNNRDYSKDINWHRRHKQGLDKLHQKSRIKRICQYCKKEFIATKSQVKYLGAKFCSRKCYNNFRQSS